MTDIEIGGIRLRAENLSQAQGHQLGAQVAALLREQIVEGAAGSREISHMQLKVMAPQNATVDRLAVQVVRCILEGLA